MLTDTNNTLDKLAHRSVQLTYTQTHLHELFKWFGDLQSCVCVSNVTIRVRCLTLALTHGLVIPAHVTALLVRSQVPVPTHQLIQQLGSRQHRAAALLLTRYKRRLLLIYRISCAASPALISTTKWPISAQRMLPIRHREEETLVRYLVYGGDTTFTN